MNERFERQLRLPVSAAEAWLWHARPGAFTRLSPPWQRVEQLARPAEIADGTRRILRLRQGPAWIRWVAEHRDVEPGRGFRDVQLQGPFALWDHHHELRPEGEGCVLKDSVRYCLPFGLAGRLLGGRSVRRDLEALFDYRHFVTLEDLRLHHLYADRPRLRVAVSGASGLLGSALCALLTTGGHEVVRLIRGRSAGRGEARWEVSEGALDKEPLEGLDAVVHLAGENIGAGRWSAERKQRLVASRVDGTASLTRSLSSLSAPPKAFLCASGISLYGVGDEPRGEEAAAGSGFLAELASRWEQAATEAEVWGARVVCLRIGVVLSPKGGALAKMLPAFRAGLGGPLGSGRQMLSWISLNDAVGATLHALMDEDFAGGVNVTSPKVVSQARFAATLGRVLGRPARLQLPTSVVEALFGEMGRETILASQNIVPRRLEEAGYRFRSPDLEQTLRDCLGRTRARP